MADNMVNSDVVESIKISKDQSSESKQMLQDIIDLLPIRIFWKDINLKYLGCNTVFAMDAGKKSPEEIIGKDDFEMNWKAQADAYRADDMAVIQSGKSKLNYDEPQTTPTGNIIWVNTNKVILKDNNGKVVGVLGTYNDITERKNLEEKSKRAEIMLESSIDGVVSANSKGEITYLNNSAEKMFGVSQGEVLGKPLTILMPEKYRDMHIAGMERFLSTHAPKVIGSVVEMEGFRKDGTVFSMEMSLSNVKTETNEESFTAIIRDISLRKKSETELKEKISQLEDMNKIMVDRELKMVELKNQIAELEKKLSEK